MAAILSQKIIEDAAQHDGRRWVRFQYDLDSGENYIDGPRLIGALDDAAALMTSIATTVLNIKAAEEYNDIISHDVMPTSFKYLTKATFISDLRQDYKDSSDSQTAMVATWLMNRLDAGDITDAECETAFGLTVNQWNTIKAKLTNLRSAWVSVETAVGQ